MSTEVNTHCKIVILYQLAAWLYIINVTFKARRLLVKFDAIHVRDYYSCTYTFEYTVLTVAYILQNPYYGKRSINCSLGERRGGKSLMWTVKRSWLTRRLPLPSESLLSALWREIRMRNVYR